MSNNFCDSDVGFDYIFTRMSAIYGNDFARKWDGIDPQIIRSEWKQTLGKFLCYKPSMDYALQHINPERPPSSLQFYKACQGGPAIPNPDAKQIGFQAPKYSEQAKRQAIEKLKELQKQMKVSNEQN